MATIATGLNIATQRVFVTSENRPVCLAGPVHLNNSWNLGSRTTNRMMKLQPIKAAPEGGISDVVEKSIKEAQETCAGDPVSGECVAAWDEVEELSAAASHARDKKKADGSDPLEEYCKDNPETNECRITIMEGDQETNVYTLVARKPSFDLPTACPNCLPAYIYLKLAQLPFELAFNSTFPDSDELPYFESDTYVAYNNEDGGVIEKLKKDGIVNLDSQLQSLSDYLSLKALIVSWLEEALTYEIWVGTEGISTSKIYYSDLPWVISKVLFYKQTYLAKNRLGITKENAEQREKQIYKRASEAYEALSTRLGEQKFLFEDRPSSLDAFLLSHILFIIQALPVTSVLRCKLLEHSNLVRYAEKLKSEFLEASSSSPSPPLHSFPSSFPRKSSKPKSKPKVEKTEEEKKFKKRARFFLAAQFLAVVIYVSVMGGGSSDELEYEDEDD